MVFFRRFRLFCHEELTKETHGKEIHRRMEELYPPHLCSLSSCPVQTRSLLSTSVQYLLRYSLDISNRVLLNIFDHIPSSNPSSAQIFLFTSFTLYSSFLCFVAELHLAPCLHRFYISLITCELHYELFDRSTTD